MKIEQFEDIEAWKKGRALTRAVYLHSKTQPFARDFSLVDQIRRAAISITSNIAEGFEREGDREFIHALSISKGSCGEVRSQLYIALDEGYITQSQFDECTNLALETNRLIGGLVKYLKTSAARHAKVR